MDEFYHRASWEEDKNVCVPVCVCVLAYVFACTCVHVIVDKKKLSEMWLLTVLVALVD